MSLLEVNDISNNNYYPLETVSDYTKYTKILFIDSSLENSDTLFSQYVNTTTYPLIYNYNTYRSSITTFLNNFTNVTRIGFAFHGPSEQSESYGPTRFINGEQLFEKTDSSDGETVFSSNFLFVKNLIQHFSLTNIDFLGCNLLLFDNWKQYFELLKGDSNVVIGASDDNTGNLKYGGDWIMENSSENIKEIYFNDAIATYADLLVSITVDVINYTCR